jgi:23S rRNA (guanine1835-N2)-methyltransferase
MKSATSSFETPYGTFRLRRYPLSPEEQLRAWSSADALLIEEAFRLNATASEIFVVNDAFGALCVALQPKALWTDSALTALALEHNENANNRTRTPVIWSTDAPTTSRLVVMRIPKQLAYFEEQLSRLAQMLPANSTLLAAGMDKHLSPATAKIIERIIGPTHRHRGQQKARLFTAVRDDREMKPLSDNAEYHCEPLGMSLHSLSNVFSRDKLDAGSRFLLNKLHLLPPVERVIDLACGNGVLGLTAIHQGRSQQLVCCDESAMAIASAKLNVSRLSREKAQKVEFHHGDGLSAYRGKPARLILCNPPFHMQHVVDEQAGRHLLSQCRDHLEPGGRLCFVANRHLNYLPSLRGLFPHTEKIAGNAKFNIFLAYKE